MLPQHNNFPCATNRPNMDDEMNQKKKKKQMYSMCI